MPDPTPEFLKLVSDVADRLHAGRRIDAAALVVKLTGRKAPLTEAEALEPLLAFLHFCLDNDFYAQAARLLWRPELFTAEPRSTQMIWNAIRSNSRILLQGSASMSKTYATGVYFFLDWLRDPEYTTVRVLGPSEDHLQSNLFSHIVGLHRNASLPMPGRVGDLFIGLDLRDRRSAISGVIVPIGRKAAGRLQGAKRFPRRQEHPKLGKLSRMRVLLDEFEKIPVGIHADLDNLSANIEGTDGLKIVGAYNPQDVGGIVHRIAEPQSGWKAFDIETDEEWTSRRNWHVVRLDAHKSENVMQNKVIFPGLQTADGLRNLAEISGGTDSPGYYTFGRGAYPPQGATFSIIPATTLQEAKAEVLWLERPKEVGSVDSSLEGSDAAVMAFGLCGLASGLKYPPSVKHPTGHEVMFRDARGVVSPRPVLQLMQLIEIPKGDTVRMSKRIKELAQQLQVPPDAMMLDRTGNGAGVHDLLKEIWGPEVRGVNYTEGATKMKVLEEDAQTAQEAYERVYSEIWFATRKWVEFGALKIHPAVETGALYDQFTNRLYFAENTKRARVESKRDYKSRGFKSPNEADAVTLLVHCCRVAFQIVPSMLGAPRSVQGTVGRYEPEMPFVSVTDRLDDFDRGEDSSAPRSTFDQFGRLRPSYSDDYLD